MMSKNNLKYFFILNPGSRGGNSKGKIKALFSLLKHRGVDYQYAYTSSMQDALVLSKKGNVEGYDVVVAVGGDGTINQVINGFYDGRGHRISSTKLGVIYTGTSPDFCKSYHIPLKPDQALNVILRGHSIPIEIGLISFMETLVPGMRELPPDAHPHKTTAYFACCANVGLGAALARQANRGIRKYTGDRAGTFLSLLKVLCRFRASDYVCETDNKKVTLKKVHNISIGKTRYIASGIRVNHRLKDHPGAFYQMNVQQVNFKNLPGILRTIYGKQEIDDNDNISLIYGKAFKISGNSVHPEVEFDGDPRGYLPCEIKTAGDPLDVIVPAMET